VAPKDNKRSSLSGIRSLKKVSLANTIADTIAQAIADQSIKPGERIVEVTLAEKLNVSRVPVREALKILATQGVLREGRQSYEVPEASDDTGHQVQEARILLESLLLRDAIQAWRADPGTTLDALNDALQQMKAAAHAGSHEAFRRSDLAFHREISIAAHNEVVRTLWETIARHVLIVLNVPSYRRIDLRELTQRHVDLHAFILRQIESPGSLEDIRAALEAHFIPTSPATR
jgi:DNA-binding GntR family transcriptional regulator